MTADIAKNGEKVTLTLTGEPMLVAGGLTWARDDYVRCRDACLLIRPLREALDGPTRPLVVPREVRGSLGYRPSAAARASARAHQVPALAQYDPGT